jgi:hypothetical protein
LRQHRESRGRTGDDLALPCPATNPADHRYSLVDPTVMETRVAQLIVAELPTISLA